MAESMRAACESVRWADELVVVDSGSTDATPDIAREFADVYVETHWRGFTGQKQYGATLCRNEWVFFVEADEECSPELAKEILELSDAELESYDLVSMKRRNYILSRYVPAWDPDYMSRLIHRDRCLWRDEVLHDARYASHPSRHKWLNGWIYHKRKNALSFSDYFCGSRLDKRLLMVAESMYESGRRCTWSDLVIRPAFAFFKFYVLKRAFTDGKFGLLIAQKAAVSVQLKYSALWAYQELRSADKSFRAGGSTSESVTPEATEQNAAA